MKTANEKDKAKEALKPVDDRKVGKKKPRRPLSVIMVFLEEFRRTFYKEYTFSSINQAGRQNWNSMSQAVFAGEETMQGLAATTTSHGSTFLAPRTHSPILRKYVNPRVCFPNFDSFPKLSLSVSQKCPREITPLSAAASMEFAAASSMDFPGAASMDFAAEASGSPKQLFAHGLPSLAPGFRRHRRPVEPARAFKDDFFKIKLPKIAERPEWWWRTLACVPYLISLQISDVGFYVQPFLEKYDAIGDMIYFIPGAINRWPSWFFMLYCYLGYMFVVKNKDLPHYFRFHMMLGMLLETALQIIWCTSNFFPLIHFKGRFGMYYWMAIGFTYICLLLECIRCALAGVYAQIPFVTDAASIHTLFNLGGFSRPLR